MKIFHDNGWAIIRSPEVLDYLSKQVNSTEVIASSIKSIRLNLQEWGTAGVHFSGLHRATNTPSLIKVGASEREIFWMNALSQKAPDLIPEVFLSGLTLGELKIGWIVMEAVRYNAIDISWGGNEFGLLIEAGVRFQHVAREIHDSNLPSMTKDMLIQWLEEGLKRNPPGPADKVLARVDQDYDWLTGVCEFETCHGDLHVCNGLSRNPPPDGPALLIDMEPINQPWAFDAAYLQVLNSFEKTKPGHKNLVSMMREYRKRFGMNVCAEDAVERLSRIVLGWFAIRYWDPEVAKAKWAPDYCEELGRYISDLSEEHVPVEPLMPKSSTDQTERGMPPPSAPVIDDFGPRVVKAGVPFNLQPSGKSALWFSTKNATWQTFVVFGDHELRTVVARDGRTVTAIVPADLVQAPGQYAIHLFDKQWKQKSGTVILRVE